MKNNFTQIKKTMISLKEKLNENDIWHGLKVEKSSETLCTLFYWNFGLTMENNVWKRKYVWKSKSFKKRL